MRIKQVTIYGFGKWIDVSFRFPTNGLLCLYGENEAGKSTLQEFILFILFGLPPRKRKTFLPKRSNHFGGSMTLEDERIGTFTIERTENDCRCFIENGEEKDEAWLKDYLKGMNREVFEAIYAFSLHDLLQIRKMKETELSDILFSVGLTGAAMIYEVEKKLSNKISELFKKAGTRPVINEQLKTVKTLYNEMETYRKEEAAYLEMRKKERWLKEELHHTEKHVQTIQQELKEKESMLQLLSMIHEYRQALASLKQYPASIPFPEEGLSRYERLKEALIPLKSEYSVFHEQKQQYEHDIIELKKKQYPKSIYERAKSLLLRKQEAQTVKEELEKFMYEREFLKETIKERTREIGIERTEIEHAQFPYHLEQRWEEIYTKQKELQNESEKLEEEYNLLRIKQKEIDSAIRKLEAALLEKSERKRLEKDVFNYEMAHSFIENNLEERKRIKELQEKQKRQSNLFLIGTIVISLFSAGVGFFYEHAFFYIIALMILLFGYAFVKISKSSFQAFEQTNQLEKTSLISEEKYRLYSEKLKEHDQAEAKLERIMLEKNDIDKKLEEWKRKNNNFEQKEINWMKRVELDREQYPFLIDIEPLYWRQLLAEIRKILSFIDQETTLLETITLLREKERSIEQQLSELAHEMGSKDSITFQQVEEIVATYEIQENRLKQLHEEFAKRKEEVNQLTEKINAYEKVVQELFELAGVKNEEEFYLRARKRSEKERLEQKTKYLYEQLANTFSASQIESFVDKELNELDLQENVTQLQREFNKNEEKMTKLNRELAALEVKLKQLETSEKRSLATMKYKIALDKLNDLAKKWAMYQLAYTSLQRAKSSYQEKYLSEVIEKTKYFFHRLTNGKYTNVFPPSEQSFFQVEVSDHLRYTVEELSQGTIDQLYISLRMAIAEVMNDRFSFPLIMDDAVLQFDRYRRKQFIQLIEEIAEKEQIIFLTCNDILLHEFSNAFVATMKEGQISFR